MTDIINEPETKPSCEREDLSLLFHNLLNKLTIISGFSEIILDKQPDNTYAKSIFQCAQDMYHNIELYKSKQTL